MDPIRILKALQEKHDICHNLNPEDPEIRALIGYVWNEAYNRGYVDRKVDMDGGPGGQQGSSKN